jgi:hypothetical protein
MVVKKFLLVFYWLRAVPVIMIGIFALYIGGGRAAGAGSPASQQATVVPLQGSGFSPPCYHPARPGYEYAPNPQYNGYANYDYGYGGPTYIERKAQPPYMTQYGEPVLEEWQYSGGYQGALNRGEIQYQPGYNSQMAPASQGKGR